jgi:DUF1680 family protein
MPPPNFRQLNPVLAAPPELRLTINGLIGDRIGANESNWLIPAPATNPGIIEIFNQRLNLRDNPVAWAGEFAGKYLISAVQSLRLTSNPALDFVVRQFVSQLIATQGTDGSLGLPLQWDLWGQYHVILGLLRWYEQTGDNNALAACERAADLACARYLNRVSAIATDDLADAEKNQAIAHALTVLYEFTGQAKYLELALAIESDWASSTGVNGFLEHALAGGEFYNGPRPRWETLHDVQAIAELYFITGQASYRQAFEQIWRSIRQFDRHASGGFTSGEAATGNPFDPRYIETCGTVAWMSLSIDMLRITADSTVADELELSLFNAILGAQSADGRLWTYHTPMGGVPIETTPPPANRVGYRLPAYYDLAWQARDRYSQLSCCATNGPRGIGCLAEWAVMRSEDAVVVNFYGPLTTMLSSPVGTAVTFTQRTDYPASGAIAISVEVSASSVFTVRLRIPAWSRKSTVAVNGVPVPCNGGTYCSITRQWNTGDAMALSLDMSPRQSMGTATAQGLAATYYGPLLLALDTADTAFDPFSPPKLNLAMQPQFATGPDYSLRATFQSSQGLVLLRDFASAGRSQEGFLTGRPNSAGVWQFSRSDQSMIAEQITLLGNGAIQGYSNPNEAGWGYEGDLLTFFAQGGAPSTRFTLRLEQHGKQVLSGFSLLDPSVRHLLSEVDFGIVGKTWQFRRLTASGEITLLPIVRLLAGGGFDIPTNANENRWAMEGTTLVFYAANGAPSTRFTSIRMQNGRTEWRGQFLFDSSITHELLEIDLGMPSMIWRFFRQGEIKVIADKVRLLPNQEIDGYQHPNEARWEPASQPGGFLFRSASGAVSTTFDTVSVNQGIMLFTGKFLFDPTITHVLQEVAPGWHFDSTYISWLPV